MESVKVKMNHDQQTYYTDPRVRIYPNNDIQSTKQFSASQLEEIALCNTKSSNTSSSLQMSEPLVAVSKGVLCYTQADTDPTLKGILKSTPKEGNQNNMELQEYRKINSKKRFWHIWNRQKSKKSKNELKSQSPYCGSSKIVAKHDGRAESKCVGVQVGAPTHLLVNDIKVKSSTSFSKEPAVKPTSLHRMKDHSCYLRNTSGEKNRCDKCGSLKGTSWIKRGQRPCSTMEMNAIDEDDMAYFSDAVFEEESHAPSLMRRQYIDTVALVSIDEVSESLLEPALHHSQRQYQRVIPDQQQLILRPECSTIHRKTNIPSDYQPITQQHYDSIETSCISGGEQLLNHDQLTCLAQFYKCMGSSVYVARSLAIVFTNNRQATATLQEWKRSYVGVPVWVFNCGLFRGKPRRLQLIVAELGSGFILLDSTVDWRSDVRQPRPNFLTLYIKNQDTVLALRFLSTEASLQFYDHYLKISQDIHNADIFDHSHHSSASSGYPLTDGYARKDNSTHKKNIVNVTASQPPISSCRCVIQRVTKKSISTPIGFKHVNSLRGLDNRSLYSLRALV